MLTIVVYYRMKRIRSRQERNKPSARAAGRIVQCGTTVPQRHAVI
jgi:hypothetical protein